MTRSRFVEALLRCAFVSAIALLPGPGVRPVEAGRLPIIYVDGAATGANDGTSWSNAYVDLQDALVQSASGDEIWVARGVYLPVRSGTPDRSVSFQLVDGVAVYGGFRGTESTRDERDPDPFSNQTVLSGDLRGDDTSAGKTDNSIVVVNAYGTSGDAILDGFTISGGNASGSVWGGDDRGAGIYCQSGSPTLANLLVTDNVAELMGGGMFNDGDPTLTNVTFESNETNWGGGLFTYGAPSLTHVTFRENVTKTYGGGMYVRSGNPTLTDVSFQDNMTGRYGGGLVAEQGSTTLTDVEFLRNRASGWSDSSGGGLIVWSTASATLTRGTFGGNSAVFGGGIYDKGTLTLVNATFSGNSAEKGGGLNVVGDATVTNATFVGNQATAVKGAGGISNDGTLTAAGVMLWGNVPDQLATGRFAGSDVGYSVVQGGCPIRATCSGTLVVADPRLVRSPSPGPDGSWDGVNDDYGDLRIGDTSPAIDAGDNAAVPAGTVTDLAGEPRFKDAPQIPDTGNGAPPVIDIGAFENQS